MDLGRLRFSEYVPPAPVADTRRLRGLPSSWGRAIAESDIDALRRRAEGIARALSAHGKPHVAADLRRTSALLGQADAIHSQAMRVETVAQLCRAMEALTDDLSEDDSIAWLQAGALPTAALEPGHGPAFKATAELRNRAFRSLEAAVARHTR